MLDGDSSEVVAETQDAVDPIEWPSDGQVSVAWIEKLQATLVHGTWKRKPEDLPQIFPPQVRRWPEKFLWCSHALERHVFSESPLC